MAIGSSHSSNRTSPVDGKCTPSMASCCICTLEVHQCCTLAHLLLTTTFRARSSGDWPAGLHKGTFSIV